MTHAVFLLCPPAFVYDHATMHLIKCLLQVVLGSSIRFSLFNARLLLVMLWGVKGTTHDKWAGKTKMIAMLCYKPINKAARPTQNYGRRCKGQLSVCKLEAATAFKAAAAAACMSERDGVTEALTAGVTTLLPAGVSRNASSIRCCRVPERLLLCLHHSRREGGGSFIPKWVGSKHATHIVHMNTAGTTRGNS